MEIGTFKSLPKYKNKQEIAYDEIKDAIVSCRLKPGQPLVIRTLASQLGISEIPVREALKRLISENFVTENSSNLSVSNISLDEFLDMLDVKLDIQLIAIKLTSKKITDNQIQILKDIFCSMTNYFEKKDFDSYKIQHTLFHLEACKFCGVPYLISALETAFAHHERAINYFNLSLWVNEPSLDEHSAILDDLVARDSESATEHLYNNVKKAYDLYRKQIRELSIK